MNSIVEEAMNCKYEWKHAFVSTDWRRVENPRCPDSIPLSEILNDTIDFTLTQSDRDILLEGFRDVRGRFDYQGFLLEFFKKMSVREGLRSRTASIGGSDDTRGTQLWDTVRQKLTHIQSVNAFIASTEERARQRALAELLKAVGRQNSMRFGYQMKPFTGALRKSEFKRELQRVFNIDLTKIEADSLFEVFDSDGNGILSASEFMCSFNQMLVERRRRDEQTARDRITQAQERQKRRERVVAKQREKVLAKTALEYNCRAYEKAVVKLSEAALQTGVKCLYMPDGYVSLSFARTAIREQLGVMLSPTQMYSLCVKISGEVSLPRQTCPDTESTMLTNSSSDSVSNTAASLASSRERTSDCSHENSAFRLPAISSIKKPEKDAAVMGKNLKAFYVHVRKISAKRAREVSSHKDDDESI
eukprot:CAMPEP_0185037410 /NCGR_PEP_ID=MMETSP1103-20130426/31761_1 /TAXON_ID=36769 /ORGANISM="Paraphysomonas bandaiensis, Strain Caron Lab Isolate" /LENGTH=417 /DNA_ID=CAMNT_0027575367 /DNA_START=285 /DNA_END=1538 /DNA_ORIENTATION=+